MSSAYFIQGAATIGVLLMTTQAGIQNGWTSPNLARLTSNSSKMRLNSEETSWVAASPGLGKMLGSVFGAVSVDLLGTKKTILLSSALTSAMWTCMMVTETAAWLYVVRTLGGLASAFILCSYPLYLGEIAAPKFRGTLISVAASGLSFGGVIGTVAESYLPPATSTLIYLIQCFIGLFIFVWLSDTPQHLIRVQDEDEAKKSISFYHPACRVDQELKITKELVKCDADQKFSERLRELGTPRVRKSVVLIMVLFVLPSLGGDTVMKSYMELILKKAKVSIMKPKDFVIYVNIAEVVATFLTVSLIDRLGRKFLLIVASVGSAAAMLGLGIHFYLLNLGVDAQTIQWLPLYSVMCYSVLHSIGYWRVANTILGEIFPQHLKSFGTCIAGIFTSSSGFLTVKTYQYMVNLIGESSVFGLFALLPFIITPYILMNLQETKGKTLQEIQVDISKSYCDNS